MKKTLYQRGASLGCVYYILGNVILGILIILLMRLLGIENFNFSSYAKNNDATFFWFPIFSGFALSLYSMFLMWKTSQYSHDVLFGKGKNYGEWIGFFGSLVSGGIWIVFIVLYFVGKGNWDKKIFNKIVGVSGVFLKILIGFWGLVIFILPFLIIQNNISDGDSAAINEYIYYEGILGGSEELQNLNIGKSYCDSEECRKFFQDEILLINS